ncbi:MAG TPA: L,D-transpeptidase [Nitrospirota bacterium]|nr:L,D-transpeptidase [Nitrospirota bacterium]
MAQIRRKIFFSLRLVTSLLLLSGISPAPEVPANKNPTSSFTRSSQDGQPRIVIWKSRYTLTLYMGNTPVKTYHAVFGKGYRDGDKQMTGDKRTPEGEFYICSMNNSKRFYKFLGLSYPGIKHAAYGLRFNIITPNQYAMIKKAIDERQQPPWDTELGGAVGIHGRMLDDSVSPQALSRQNWTDGCIALNNTDVDEIYSVVSLGTPVTILP